MNAQKQHFQLSVIAAALLAAFGTPAFAEGDEVKELVSPDSSVSVSVGNWSKDRMHEGMYDGMRDNGTYVGIDADIRKRDDASGTWTNLSARNLGKDNAEISGSYEKQGDWGIGLGYSQTPRYNPVIINTGLQGIGTERQTITPVATPGAGTNRLLEMRRDAASLDLFKIFSDQWNLSIKFKNEEKNGDRQWGVRTYPTLNSTVGSYPAFIAEPINSTTQQLDATLSFSGEKLSLTGGYYGSWYNNHNNRLDVIGTAAGVTEMSLPPDNQAHQGYIQGTYQLSPSTRGNFRAAYTHATQNDPFMSTTNNGVAAWAPTATVGSSLQGVVNTTDVMASLTARPIKQLSLVAKLNYLDRNDKTSVRVDSQSGLHNNPFSYTKTSGTVEGTYRLQAGYSVKGGIDYTDTKREFDSQINTATEFFSPYRTKLKETTYRVAAVRSLTDTLNGSVGYSFSKRTGSSYLPAEGGPSAGFDIITPIHVADRERDKWKLALDWSPTEALGLQFNFADAQDKYPDNSALPSGVRKGAAQFWGVDATYTLNDNWQVNGWYSYDINKIRQIYFEDQATTNLKEKADTFGFGVKGKVTGKLDIGMNFEWMKTNAEFNEVTSVARQAGTVALPSIETKIARLNLYGIYTLDKRSNIRVDVITEDWKSNDWTWAFSNGSAYSYLTENTQVINPKNQSGAFIGARYAYKFQ
jgi:MtrB/PioB family decaheme-associated outer membrane protein